MPDDNNYFTTEDLTAGELPESQIRIPQSVRLKAKKIAEERIEVAKERARTRALQMTPKKAAKLSKEQVSAARERARKRLAWQKAQVQGQGTPLHDLPEQPGEWPEYYQQNTPERRARFTPRKNLQNLPFELKEGVKEQILERSAVPDEAADELASNAIDRWINLVVRRKKGQPPQQAIDVNFQPKFLVHPFSDVKYDFGDSLASSFSGFGQYDTDIDPVAIMENIAQETRSPYQEPIDILAAQTTEVDDVFTADIKDAVPITETNPLTREPLDEPVVEKPVAVPAQAESKSKLLIPLAIGAGLVVFFMTRKG